jgi:hypothetical protein
LEPRFGSFPPRCRFLLCDQTKAATAIAQIMATGIPKQPLTGWAVVQAHAGLAVLALRRRGGCCRRAEAQG